MSGAAENVISIVSFMVISSKSYCNPEKFCPIFALKNVVQNFSGKLNETKCCPVRITIVAGSSSLVNLVGY
jgi:hypothetical protein